MPESIQSFFDRLIGLHHLLTSDQSRSYWGYLLATAGIVFIVYLTNSRQSQRSLGAFFRFLFPRQVYAHHSFRVDLKLVLFLHLAVPAGWFLEGWALTEITNHVADGFEWLVGVERPISSHSNVAKVALGVMLFVVSDFARFANHWLHHRIPVLWELHSVHHSAEHLNPLTTYRFHPLELMMENLSVVLFVGVLAGLVSSFLGGNPISYYGTIYAWTYLRAANALGSNLRHMHVWWAWNTKLSHVLVSPAQHQIHHSTDPKHYDKNFGFFFAIWDWMFGTIYVPRHKETLEFGLTTGVSHKGLRGALFTPLVRAAGVVRRRASASDQRSAS